MKENCNCEEETCNCEKETCICEEPCECKQDHDKKQPNKVENDHDKKNENKKAKKKEVEQKIKQLEEQLKIQEEKNLREKAENINYRKRKDEEMSRILKYSNEDIAKQLLPVLDSFERAIDMDDDNLEDELSKFLEGFKMIYHNLNSILENFDIRPIDLIDIRFDPTYHEAVATEKKEGTDSGMVIEVLQKGYLLKDKVIRPAMVKVSE